MKFQSNNRLLPTVIAHTVVCGLAASHATEVIKANNTDALNLGSSWVDDPVTDPDDNGPGTGDVALWNNPFAVTAETTTSAIVCNATSTGAVRSIALNGVISGGGAGSVLTFRNQGYMPVIEGGIPATGSKGFILTQSNTFTGTIRVEDASNNVNYGSFLRVGAGTTSTDGRNYSNGGNLGTLPTAAAVDLVNVRSVLLLMRNDTHSFANNLSGQGQLWIGHSTSPNTTTNSQIVTISGSSIQP